MFSFVWRVVSEFGKDKAGTLSAAFAYVAVFSIGPLLLVLVSIVGLIYGKKAAAGQLYDQLSTTFGPETARTLQSLAAHLSHTGSSAAALAIGIVGLLLGAIGMTAQLQSSFDIILRAKGDPGAGIKFTIYTKLKNITIILAGSLIAVASILATTLTARLGKGLGLEALNTLVSLIIFIVVLYLVYRFLPDVAVPRWLAFRAAFFVGLLFLVGKVILGFVIGRNGTASAYGAAASLVVLLLWFYYTAQILMFGAEGIKVYGEAHRVDFLPKRYAVRLKELDVLAKKDFRGRLLEAFSRGYKRETKNLK
jgi:membrane protein